MQFTLEQIETEITGDQLVPGRLADFRLYLGALYSARATRMQKLLAEKPKTWLALRETRKRDTATDRAWEMTEEGQCEIQLKWDLRRIDKLSSAIAGKLRILEGESRNNF